MYSFIDLNILKIMRGLYLKRVHGDHLPQQSRHIEEFYRSTRASSFKWRLLADGWSYLVHLSIHAKVQEATATLGRVSCQSLSLQVRSPVVLRLQDGGQKLCNPRPCLFPLCFESNMENSFIELIPILTPHHFNLFNMQECFQERSCFCMIRQKSLNGNISRFTLQSASSERFHKLKPHRASSSASKAFNMLIRIFMAHPHFPLSRPLEQSCAIGIVGLMISSGHGSLGDAYMMGNKLNIFGVRAVTKSSPGIGVGL